MNHLPPFPNLSFDPSQTPTILALSHIDTDNSLDLSDNPAMHIAQLNCFNGKMITLSILANKKFSILILQEPWIDPHTLRLPPHPAWHDFTPYDHFAKDYSEKPRTGIYISKRIPSWLITALPSKTPLLTAVEMKIPNGRLWSLRIIAAYNPPTHNTGLLILKSWLSTHNNRQVATIIGIERNLHHPKWNPASYNHTHTLAKELIKICGSAGFKIISQNHIPTFYPRARNARPTAIDLTWANFELTKHSINNSTSSKNFGSDHQLLLTTIHLDEPLQERTHNNARFATMAQASYCADLEIQLRPFPNDITSPDEIDSGVKLLTDVVMGAF